MKAKRIVQISSYYPPHLGGQEHVVQDLARQLAAAGHRVDVFTSSMGGHSNGIAVEEGVKVRRFAGFVFGHAPIMPGFPLALLRHVKKSSVVHIHIGQAFTPEVLWAVSKLRRFKYIAELHIDFEPSGPAGVLLPLYKRLVLKRVLNASSAIIVLNRQALRAVRERYGYKGRAQIMSNGIDEAYFSLRRPAMSTTPPGTLRLVFVGRLTRQKNIGTLLQALRNTRRCVHLDVIGDGEEREEVERMITDYNLTNVTFHGRLEREEVRKFYELCDALIMPSLYEAQPLVLLEAMAARIPIIATNVTGVADHLTGIGIVVEPTTDGIRDGIDRYYRDYERLPQMVARGYAKAQNLQWGRLVKKYEELYEAALDD